MIFKESEGRRVASIVLCVAPSHPFNARFGNDLSIELSRARFTARLECARVSEFNLGDVHRGA